MVLSSPAYSIGKSKRSSDWKTGVYYVPGAGTYNPLKPDRNNLPSWKIGTGPRGLQSLYNNPGPGQYENDNTALTKTHFPKYRFGIKNTHQNSARLLTPGPGSYDPDNKNTNKSAPLYSFGFKGLKEAPYNNPGPGAYEVINDGNNIKSRPASKIGSAKRDQLYKNNETPGPGSYHFLKDDFSSAPKIRFGSSTRDKLMEGVLKSGPGPGAYDVRGHFDNNLLNGTTIIPRRNDVSMNARAQTPGPGTYNPEKMHAKIPPAFRIGSANRTKFEGLETFPGPGQYDPRFINRPASASHRIGTGHRSNFAQGNNNPGPGNYETFSQLKGPKHFIAGKKEKKLDLTNPGPGTYEPMLSFVAKKAPEHLIGTSIRNDFMKKKETPGPGQYDIRKDLGGPKYPFGSEPRGELYRGSAEPGPGSYNLPPKFADVPKYLLNISDNQ